MTLAELYESVEAEICNLEFHLTVMEDLIFQDSLTPLNSSPIPVTDELSLTGMDLVLSRFRTQLTAELVLAESQTTDYHLRQQFSRQRFHLVDSARRRLDSLIKRLANLRAAVVPATPRRTIQV